MQKSLLIVVLSSLFINSQSHGMEETSAIPKIWQIPAHYCLRPYQCKICKKECRTRCANCKGTYYCSTTCQNIDKPQHKQNCKLLQMAFKGDPYQMERFFISDVRAANSGELNETTIKKAQNEAFVWLSRLVVRLVQDNACHKVLADERTAHLLNSYFSLIKKTELCNAFTEISAEKFVCNAAQWTREIGSALIEPCSIDHLSNNFTRPLEQQNLALFYHPTNWNVRRFSPEVVKVATELLQNFVKQAKDEVKKRIQCHINLHSNNELN